MMGEEGEGLQGGGWWVVVWKVALIKIQGQNEP